MKALGAVLTFIMLSAYCLVRSAALVQAEPLRDPFTFGPREREGAHAQPMLAGIMWDPAHPMALLGDELVAVDDEIAGWKVVEIREDGITVQRDTRREFITSGSPLPAD